MTDAPSRKRSRIRRIILWLCGAALALCACLLALLLAMQTGPARRYIEAEAATRAAAVLGMDVRVEGLSGFLPTDIEIASIAIDDDAGAWLEIRDVHATLSATALLRGVVNISLLSSEEIIVHRAPSVPSNAQEPPASWGVADLPPLPTWLRVDEVNLKRVQFHETPDRPRLDLHASAVYQPSLPAPIQLSFDALGDLKLTGSLSGGWTRDAIALDISLEDGLLAPNYLSEDGPLLLSASISGPLKQAKLRAQASIGGNPLLDLAGVMSPVVPMSLTLDGTVSPPRTLLPESTREFLNDPVTLGLEASLNADGSAAITRLGLATPQESLTAAGAFNLNTQRADLTYQARAADLSRYTSESNAQAPVPLEVKGLFAGTPLAFTLNALAEISGKEWAKAESVIESADGVAARGALKINAAEITLPPSLDALLGQGADANFDLHYKDTTLRIAALDLRLAAAQLAASGTLDIAAATSDLSLDVKADDLAVFSAIAGTGLAGTARATLSVKGDGTQTTLQADARGDAIAAGTVRAPEASLHAEVRGRALRDLLAGRLGVKLSASLPGLELQPGLPQDLKVETAFEIEDLKRISVAKLDLNDGNLAATASGKIDVPARQADFSAALKVADAAAYAKPLGYPYGGKLAMDLTIASASAPDTIEVSAKGALENLSGFPKGAEPFMSGASSFNLHGQFDTAQVRVDSLEIAASGLTASGSGAYGIQDRAVVASLSGNLKDLAPIGAFSGQAMAGSAEFTADITGKAGDVAAHGAFAAKGLRVDSLRADKADASFNLEGLPKKTHGEITAALTTKGETLDASMAFSQDGDTFHVSRLSMNAGANALTAEGQWDIAKRTGAGTVNAELPSLDVFQKWFAVPIKGAASMEAQLAPGSAKLTASMKSKGVQFSDFTVGSAEGTAEIERPFDRPSGNLALSAAALAAGDLAISDFGLTAEGPEGAVQLAVKAEGIYQQAVPFTLDASARSNLLARRFDIQSLGATVGTQNIALDAPASLASEGKDYSLSPARVRIGNGYVELQGAVSEKAADAHIVWKDISLALAEFAGDLPLQGTTSGTATLSGTPAVPMLNAAFTVARFRIAEEDASDAPGIDSSFTAQLGGGAASASVDASLPNALQLKGSARVPFEWSLVPWHANVAEQAPLEGRLKAQGALDSLPELLGLDGHVLRGSLDADLALKGTVASPQLEGRAALASGYYENIVTGTILDQMSAAFEAQGQKFVLTQFSATDSENGKLDASGKVSITGKMPFQLETSLENMRLARRDEVTADVSGTLSVDGDNAGAKVTGELTVSPATVTLPSQLPSEQVTTVPFRIAGEEDTNAPETHASVFNYPITLDVRCVIAETTTVRARGLKSDWVGDLAVKGDARAPSLKGVLRVRTGKLSFLGREFDLRESTITFDGRTPPSPVLNILAVSEQRNVTARVRLEGEPDALNVTLESDPPSSPDNVLSQVLFGRSVQEITPLQGLQLARYAALFNSRVSGSGILGGGASASVLDRLSFESGSGLSDSAISAGKSLNDNLYLEIEQGAGSNSSAVTLEWLFAPNWLLRGKTGSNAEGGAGLFWKKDY